MASGYDLTLSGLLRKRAELAGQAEAMRAQLSDKLSALDHIAGPYLNAYANEMAWREDHRRVANGNQAGLVTRAALASPQSRQWAGYWQRAA